MVTTTNNDKKGQAGMIKGWILKIIDGIDCQMLVNMIKKKEIPTLWAYELPPYLNFAKGLAIEYKAQILEQLSLENIIIHCKEYRPDLAQIIQHPAGKRWMSRFLNKMRFMFKNIELEDYEIQRKYENILRERAKKREREIIEKEQAIQEGLMLEEEVMNREIALREKEKILEAETAQEQTISEMPDNEPEVIETESEPETDPTPLEIDTDTTKFSKDDLYGYL